MWFIYKNVTFQKSKTQTGRDADITLLLQKYWYNFIFLQFLQNICHFKHSTTFSGHPDRLQCATLSRFLTVDISQAFTQKSFLAAVVTALVDQKMSHILEAERRLTVSLQSGWSTLAQLHLNLPAWPAGSHYWLCVCVFLCFAAAFICVHIFF